MAAVEGKGRLSCWGRTLRTACEEEAGAEREHVAAAWKLPAIEGRGGWMMVAAGSLVAISAGRRCIFHREERVGRGSGGALC